jgi:hypothetical protein
MLRSLKWDFASVFSKQIPHFSASLSFNARGILLFFRYIIHIYFKDAFKKISTFWFKNNLK